MRLIYKEISLKAFCRPRHGDCTYRRGEIKSGKICACMCCRRREAQLGTDAHPILQEKEKYVKLISSDDVEFIVDKKAASVSSTIKKMLTSEGTLMSFRWPRPVCLRFLDSKYFYYCFRWIQRARKGRDPFSRDQQRDTRESLPVLLLQAQISGYVSIWSLHGLSLLTSHT